MAKEYNDMKKKAVRYVLERFADGKEYTFNDIHRLVLFEFGLGKTFVQNEIINLFGDRLELNGEVYSWKKN